MAYDPSNIFARIIRGEISSKKVLESDAVLAFHDVAPAAPVHVLVVPKGDYVSFDDFALRATPETISNFFKTVQNIASSLGLPANGYRLITNHGADASQSVPHFHVHILGGKSLGGLLPDDVLKR